MYIYISKKRKKKHVFSLKKADITEMSSSLPKIEIGMDLNGEKSPFFEVTSDMGTEGRHLWAGQLASWGEECGWKVVLGLQNCDTCRAHSACFLIDCFGNCSKRSPKMCPSSNLAMWTRDVTCMFEVVVDGLLGESSL